MNPLPSDALTVVVFGMQFNAYGIPAILALTVILLTLLYSTTRRFKLVVDAVVRWKRSRERIARIDARSRQGRSKLKGPNIRQMRTRQPTTAASSLGQNNSIVSEFCAELVERERVEKLKTPLASEGFSSRQALG